MKHTVKAMMLITVAAGSLLLCSCAAFFSMPVQKRYRQIHVKVVADPSYITSAAWRTDVRTLFDAVNRIYRGWFEIEFVVDTIVRLEIAAADSCPRTFIMDCVMKRVPKGDADLVVHFAKEPQHRFSLAGVAALREGYVHVRQMTGQNAREPFRYAFYTLIHELGHAFGAVHVFPREDDVLVMEPYLDYDIVSRAGTSYEMAEPKFDLANERVINALRNRHFDEKKWSAGDWPAIKACYEQQARGFKNERSMPSGSFVNFSQDEFLPNEACWFLASWASLCGLDSVAIGYIDSSLCKARELNDFCRESISFRSGQMCGSRFDDEWLDIFKAVAHHEKALILLSAHRAAEAEIEYLAFVKSAREALPRFPVDHYESEYALRKNKYADRVVVITPETVSDTAVADTVNRPE